MEASTEQKRTIRTKPYNHGNEHLHAETKANQAATTLNLQYG